MSMCWSSLRSACVSPGRVFPRRISVLSRPLLYSKLSAGPSKIAFQTFRSNASNNYSFTRPGFQQFPGSGRYQRFSNSTGASFLRRWASRPTFYYEVGGLSVIVAAFYVSNLEQVPISGRRRFNVVSKDLEQQMGQQQYQQTMQQFRGRILPPSDPRVQQVNRVSRRLIPASGLSDENWEVHVIDAPDTPNAFVIPGGKVFVFTGIMPVTGGDDGLATVLGHEIAHNVAHHAAEGMSRGFIMIGAIYVLAAFFGVPDFASQMLLNLGFEAPRSRAQESEADEIGLQIMSAACFDPHEAVDFWHRMQKAEEGHGTPPQFLSTHPSSHNREGHIRQMLPRALETYESSSCGSLRSNVDRFQQTFRGWQ